MTRSETYKRLRARLRGQPVALSYLDRLEEGEKFGEAAFAERVADFKERVNVHTIINVLDTQATTKQFRERIAAATLDIERKECKVTPDYFLAPGSMWKNRYTFDLAQVMEIDYAPQRLVKYLYPDTGKVGKRPTQDFFRVFEYVGPDIYSAMEKRVYAFKPTRVTAKHVALGYPYGLPALRSRWYSKADPAYEIEVDSVQREEGGLWTVHAHSVRNHTLTYNIPLTSFRDYYGACGGVVSNLPRFEAGDAPGLRPGEAPAILRKGEESTQEIKAGSVWRHLSSGKLLLVTGLGDFGVAYFLPSGNQSTATEKKFRRLCEHVMDGAA